MKYCYITYFLFWLSFPLLSQDYSRMLDDMRKVSFDAGMYAERDAHSKSEYAYVRNLYNAHIVSNPEYSEAPRIPKIIHQIWLGSSFPEEYKSLQETWKKHHPDWEYRLWTDQDVAAFGLYNQSIYDLAKNYGEKSDIFRYEILYRYGGLYVDTDFECVKSFDILNHICDFYIGAGYTMYGGVYNGLIGSKPGHPILKAAIEGMVRSAGDHAENIVHRTGPNYLTIYIKKMINSCPGINVVFPLSFFYPWPNYERHNKRPESIASWVRPESFAIHYWYTSWWK